jgi:hypothetical protein
MGAEQRTKGAGFEREVVNELRALLGVDVARNLDQARDGGGDIEMPPFMIECKRRQKFVAHEWMAQAERAAGGTLMPVVIVRGDRQPPLVVMRLIDWVALAREELGA